MKNLSSDKCEEIAEMLTGMVRGVRDGQPDDQCVYVVGATLECRCGRWDVASMSYQETDYEADKSQRIEALITENRLLRDRMAEDVQDRVRDALVNMANSYEDER